LDIRYERQKFQTYHHPALIDKTVDQGAFKTLTPDDLIGNYDVGRGDSWEI